MCILAVIFSTYLGERDIGYLSLLQIMSTRGLYHANCCSAFCLKCNLLSSQHREREREASQSPLLVTIKHRVKVHEAAVVLTLLGTPNLDSFKYRLDQEWQKENAIRMFGP